MIDETFATWYSQNYRSLHAALSASAVDGRRVSDALDEACARALQHWDRVKVMDAPNGWVYAVARNVQRRTQKRERQERELLIESATSSVSDRMGHDDVVEIWDAVRRLDARQREAIVLRYFLDLKERDVAVAMRVAPGTVARWLHDARAELAETLKREVLRND